MLENQIAKTQAENGELSSACAQLKEDIADNEAARATAEELRKKEKADFISEEKDMTEGLEAMDQAIDTLAAIGADQTASNANSDHAQFMGKGGSLVKLKTSVKKSSGVSVYPHECKGETNGECVCLNAPGSFHRYIHIAIRGNRGHFEKHAGYIQGESG